MGKKYTKVHRGRRKRNSLLPYALAIGGVLLIAGAFLALWRERSSPPANIEVTGAPSLKVDKEQIDLGDVRLGQWVSATFAVTNVGDKPLRFTRQPYIEVIEGC